MDGTQHHHAFSDSTMRVLTSICDTFVPSLPFPAYSAADASPAALSLGIPANERSEHLQDIAAFYQLSAASDGIPEQVAAAMARYLRPADVESVKSLLRLLGTRVGTWAMAAAIRLRGRASAGGGGGAVSMVKKDTYDQEGEGGAEEWPVARFAAFHRLPLSHRQAILRGWALGLPLSSFTIPFLLLKVFILRQFYYKVDAHGQNPVVWKAIDYCGPDPRHASVELDECDRVLESRIVDMSNITPQGKRMLRSEFGMRITAVRREDTISDHHQSAGTAAKDDAKKNAASCSCIFSDAAESDRDNADGDNKGRSVGGRAAKQKSRWRAKQDWKKAAAGGAVVRVEMKADAVIIGSGSGGSVVAAKLAEAGYKVVVMEKGGYLRRTENPLLEGKASTELYEQASNLATDDMGVFIFAGATVGGGSTVNWSASFKTPEHVRGEWVKEKGLEMFGSEGYRRAMEEVCRRIGVVEEEEGEEEEEEESLANAMLRKGCEKMGIGVGRVPRNNGPKRKHHCGWCGMGCKAGLKNGATRTWLVDAARRGAVILAGCQGRKVKTEEERYVVEEDDDGDGAVGSTTRHHRHRLRATGVEGRVVVVGGASRWLMDMEEEKELLDDDEQAEAEIVVVEEEVEIHVESRVVVASCGSLHTPPLLRRSGLLNPHIGLHLRLHPVMFIWGHFPDSPPHLTSYHGPIMSSFSPHAAHWDSSGYGSLLMVPSLHPAAFSAATPWLSPLSAKHAMLRFSNTAFLITITRDSGDGGRVFEDRSGHLHVSYDLADTDREHSVEAACLGFRILAAAGASAIGTTNLDGASLHFPHRRRRNDGGGKEAPLHDAEEEQRRKEVEEEELLEEFLSGLRHAWLKEKKPTVMGSAHQMGSCRMGKDPATSVVDTHGQTWEAKGLFVADASVFPTASGVNPMVTVQSIAFSIAHSILQFLH